MFEVIEKLLILQDRDKRIQRVRGELERIEPERQGFSHKASDAQAKLTAAKEKVKKLESDRKALELEVEGKKELIIKYSNQQFQTRKNDEYRALAHEIEMCRDAIRKIEDQELELMEASEVAQKDVVKATAAAAEANKIMEGQIAALKQREESLRRELAELEANRGELAGAVDESARSRYERLFRSKGENVVVGVQHGVCGGCHMRVPAQVLVSCQAQQELVSCTNCGRILYYSSDMDLAVAE
jgi:hypothetical protein